MKTTKKGFTLIELIVVIAIIGVLAAILVPTMLGYVKKSKISSANSTAASIYKAINSALTELDEEGTDIGGAGKISYTVTSGSGAWSGETLSTELTGKMGTATEGFDKKVKNFFADIDKVKGGIEAQLADGACVAVAAASDSTYTGTYPAGVVTSDSYQNYKGSAGVTAALTEAIALSGWTES